MQAFARIIANQVEEDMILTHFVYSTVKITYDKEVKGPGRNKWNCKEETWTETAVFFERDGDIATLRIQKGDDSLLLGRAKVKKLNPWGAEFEAYWWAGHPIKYNKDGRVSERQKNGFTQLVRANIVCEF